MSVNYVVDPRTGEISWKGLLDFTTRETRYNGVFADHSNKDNEEDSIAVSDGKNTLWAYRNGDGNASFTKYGDNDVEKILEGLSEKFGVDFVGEHDDDYRYAAGMADFSSTHHRHGVDYEVSIYIEDENTATIEWRVDGELVETEQSVRAGSENQKDEENH